MKLIFTEKPPTKEGYYYWCDFGEHTPTIVRVERDYATNTLWASNDELAFQIKPLKKNKINRITTNSDPDELVEGKYKHGDELWCYIPNPFLPGGKKQVKPDSY